MATIYRINGGDESYVGSTKNKPKYRFQEHKYDHKRGRHTCSSFILFEKYGDKCTLEILEECNIQDRYLKESQWIKRTANAVNKASPYATHTPEELNAKRLVLHECECGGKYSKAHKARHYKSTFHISHLPA
jgi:hypothetical protein